MMMDPLVTVVIPTLNRKSFLEATLRDLSMQEFKEVEIIIIDQSDEDLNYRIPNNLLGCINFIRIKEKSASLARNIGLKDGKGHVVLFLDDDIIIDRSDFILSHYKHYVNSNINGVAGAILNTEKVFTFKRHKWSYNERTGWLFFPINYNSVCYIGSAWAGNFSIRRELALKIGGMDENFEKGAFREEADFCYRYSEQFGAFLFDPKAYLIHIGAPSGGIRSFSHPVKVKAQQHYDGQFYFLFKNIQAKDYFFHFASAYFYFLHKKVKWYDIIGLFKEAKKCLKGIIKARKMLRAGPKYISSKN